MSTCTKQHGAAEPQPSQAYSASSVWANYTPDLAFDGDVTTWWNSASWPVGSIEVDLQDNYGYDLTYILFVTKQTPGGDTTHEIWVSDFPMQDDLSGADLLMFFSAMPRDASSPPANARRLFDVLDQQSDGHLSIDRLGDAS